MSALALLALAFGAPAAAQLRVPVLPAAAPPSALPAPAVPLSFGPVPAVLPALPALPAEDEGLREARRRLLRTLAAPADGLVRALALKAEREARWPRVRTLSAWLNWGPELYDRTWAELGGARGYFRVQAKVLEGRMRRVLVLANVEKLDVRDLTAYEPFLREAVRLARVHGFDGFFIENEDPVPERFLLPRLGFRPYSGGGEMYSYYRLF